MNMATYIIFLTKQRNGLKTEQIPNVCISGNGIKDTLVNAIKQFTEYQSWDSTKRAVRVGIVPSTAKDEFGLRSSLKSKYDAYWCIKTKGMWIVKKYHKPNPKGYGFDKTGYYEDVYALPISKVRSNDAAAYIKAIKE